MNRIFALVVSLLLSGCAAYSLVSANARVDIANGLSVQPARAWNQLSQRQEPNVHTWTMDGPLLDTLAFVPGLKAGNAILKDRSGKEPMPQFRAGMSPNDVADLFESTLVRGSPSPVIVKTSGLRPVKFAGRDGFRFDFTLVNQADDVERKGFATGAIVGDRLYLIFYHGTRVHYFQKNAEEAEAIMRSAQISASAA